jgi:hypothetical protein
MQHHDTEGEGKDVVMAYFKVLAQKFEEKTKSQYG